MQRTALALEIAGLVSVVAGLSLVAVWLGLVVGGVVAIVVAQFVEGRGR